MGLSVEWRRAAVSVVAVLAFGATAWWAAGGEADAFVPVAPPESIHFAMKQNLELIGDWLADKDPTSAAETAEGLAILAQMYSRSGDAEWRERVAKLRATIEQLGKQAAAKDIEAAQQSLKECVRLVGQLPKAPGGRNSATADPIRPAPTKAVMKLMDGAYSDAKATRSLKEFEHLAYTVAETANFASHLRSDARWRSAAGEVRDAVAAVARSAADKGLQAARAELKNVYQRCEACHRAYKREGSRQ